MSMEKVNLYADIIDLPHHVSVRHRKMSMENRAAQFSPFAAMVGHDAAIHETSRFTEEQLELSEEEKTIIDGKLQQIYEHIKEQPEITVTYFRPDRKKKGGAYVNITGSAKKIDAYSRLLVITDGTTIPIDNILQICGDKV